jgi:hypothetical protein
MCCNTDGWGEKGGVMGNLEWNCEINASGFLLCRNEELEGWGMVKAQLKV